MTVCITTHTYKHVYVSVYICTYVDTWHPPVIHPIRIMPDSGPDALGNTGILTLPRN